MRLLASMHVTAMLLFIQEECQMSTGDALLGHKPALHIVASVHKAHHCKAG